MTGTVIKQKVFTGTAMEEMYEACIFDSCDFRETDLSGTAFESCSFFNCNFSMTRFCCQMNTCYIHDSKLTGADFSGLRGFSGDIQFLDSDLSYAIFERAKIRRSKFTRCNLQEAAFFDADLTECEFADSDLLRAGFQGANLTKADFSSARNYSIDPSHCLLKKTVFYEHNLRGLVEHLDIDIKYL